jgi:hypothetical protein
MLNNPGKLLTDVVIACVQLLLLSLILITIGTPVAASIVISCLMNILYYNNRGFTNIVIGGIVACGVGSLLFTL